MNKERTTTTFVLTALLSCPLDGALAQGAVGDYRPVFEETGIHGTGDYYAAGSQAIVNHYGGSLLVSNKDVSIPSLGGFRLQFSRTHSSNGRLADGPLGLGWSAHYGFLRRQDPSAGAKLEYVGPSGAREVFFLHDRSTMSALHPGGTPPSTWTWISQSLRVLQLNNQVYTLYEPSGVYYTLEPSGASSVWVPTVVGDSAGNHWQITYEPNWWADYPDHPVVESVSETGSSRFLRFDYVEASGKPQLRYVRFMGNITLAEYLYTPTSNNLYLLREHRTPEDRKTVYAYYTDQAKLGALQSVTLDTGGTTTFEYDFHWLYYPGSNVYSMAVSSITRGQDGVWNYTYPNAASSNTFTTEISGPLGRRETFKYHTYAAGACNSTELWKVGFLYERTISYSGETSRFQYTPGTPLTVSDQSVTGFCSANAKPMIVRIDQVSETRDGAVLITTFDDYDFVFARRVTRPGSLVESRTYKHFVGGTPFYMVGAIDSHEVEAGGALVSRTDVVGFDKGLPTTIREYRSAGQYWTSNLGYHWSPPKAGTVRSWSRGTYSEEYDYDNGVLSAIRYSGSRPGVSRNVSPRGEVTSETVDGVTSNFAYDADGRLTDVDRPATAQTRVTYSSNKASVTWGPEQTEYTFDDWGRLTEERTRVGFSDSVASYRYDALGRRTGEVTPSGLDYTMAYDVLGRIRSRTSTDDSATIPYQTSSSGTRQTVVRNGETLVMEIDFLGRLLEGSRNGQRVTYDYSTTAQGIRNTITANGRTRSVTSDFLGNIVQEQHPEYRNNTITYTYDSRGWLSDVDQPEGAFRRTYLQDGRLQNVARSGHTQEVSYAHHPTYGVAERVTFGPVETTYGNFDAAGRARSVTTSIEGPRRLEAPGTYLTCKPE